MLKAFLINRDRLSSLKKMVEWLLDHRVQVHILDNGSTYGPLLKWYESSLTVSITKLERDFGPRVGWSLGLLSQFTDDDFILSDPDLDLSLVPNDWMDVLRQGLALSSEPKCGFSIEIEDLPEHFPFRAGVIDWESRFWQHKMPDSCFYSAPIDTTFALYRAKHRGEWPGLLALRTDRPYTVRHLPWYVDPNQLSDEEKYFVDHAGPISTYAVHMRHVLGIGRPGEWEAAKRGNDPTLIAEVEGVNSGSRTVLADNPSIPDNEQPDSISVPASAGLAREIHEGVKGIIRRVALVFDDLVRPDTTGVYCHRALSHFMEVKHFLPSQMNDLPSDFDLYLNIDDGLDYTLPQHVGPWALWAIDTHLLSDRIIRRARGADYVFAAQKNGVELLRVHGVDCLAWLPLAADPDIHKPFDFDKIFDVCFVGHINSSRRGKLVQLLQNHFPNHFVGQRFFDEMARTYSESRIVTNISVADDVNMRVFESLACRSFLITNDLSENGLSELFQAEEHYATYRSEEELVEKVKFYLARPAMRKKISQSGYSTVLAGHTYRHRMETLLRLVERKRSLASIGKVSPVLGEPVSIRKSEQPLKEAAIQGSAHQISSNNVQGQNAPSDLAEAANRCDPLEKYGLTSIIIVTFNQLAYTKACLESIRSHTESPYELIIVDNGSTDGTVEFLQEQHDVKLIRNQKNRGFPAAANQGIRESSGRYLLLLNNDVLVTSRWLERLIHGIEGHSKVGLAGPVSNNVSGPQQIHVTYQKLEHLELFAQSHALQSAGQIRHTNRLVGFCLLIKRKLINKIGMLDERFGVGNFEDDDFCLRALDAGYLAIIVQDAFVHHEGSASFRGNRIDLKATLDRNRHLFEEKWNAKRQLSSSHNAEDIHASDSIADKSAQLLESGLSKPKISLCMIVRDSARTLRECLASIRPWVDEMIVVDTGSVDQTKEIARSYGAKVHEFPWCDSFATARNESLRHASGNWIFWMDSDDTIDQVNGQKLQNLLRQPVRTKVMGFVIQVHCPVGTGATNQQGAVSVDHVKLFRNHPSLKFSGRIHEQVLGAIRSLSGEVDWTDIFVTHTGADHSPEGKARKYARDLRLLELELRDDPDSTFALFNLGMTLVDMQDYQRGLDALCRSLQLASTGDSHVRKLYALLVQTYLGLGRPGTALKTCLLGLAVCPEDPELLFRMGVLEQGLGRLDHAQNTFLRVLTLSRERHFSSVDQSIFNVKAWHNLAVIYEQKKDYAAAQRAWRRVIEHQPLNRPAWWSLVVLGMSDHDGELLGKLIEQESNASSLLDVRTAVEAQADVAAHQFLSAVERIEQAEQGGYLTDELLDLGCQFAFENELSANAEYWLKELVRRQPNNASAVQNLAVINFKQNDFVQAATLARHALVLRPGYQASTALLSQAERLLGDNPDRSISRVVEV